MAGFGRDWARARQGWLYPVERLQGFWRAIGITAVLLLVNVALQTVLGLLLVMGVFHGTLEGAMSHQGTDYDKVLQAGILVIFPAGLVTLFLGIWLGKFGLPKGEGVLLLNWPRLGWLGWLITVGGFAVLMFITLAVIGTVLHIDPDTKGLVEKTLVDMAQNKPLLFALAIPAVIFGAPLAEEITFRGPLFSALVKSPVGKAGAVLITAALWAGAHAVAAPPVFLGLLFLMGIVLGLLLLRFGSLWVTIACHSAWNVFTALALFAASVSQ
ncbi:MAG: CPBP family intramembrane glutamic endopeptidase [Aestuariivirga sp.]